MRIRTDTPGERSFVDETERARDRHQTVGMPINVSGAAVISEADRARSAHSRRFEYHDCHTLRAARMGVQAGVLSL